MRIGLYGGIANNMYVYAKALSAAGVDVCFIRDRSDCYPMSQPVWEDTEFRLPYEVVRNSGAGDWNIGRLTDLELRLTWEAPEWLHDPSGESVGAVASISPRGLSVFDEIIARRYVAGHGRLSVLSMMRQCDALMVCGIEGSILANSSGRPYIVWPHGGDMLIAAGLMPPPLGKVRERFYHMLFSRQLDAAFRNAICIGNHEPTGITSDYFGAEGYLRTLRVAYMPIPIPVRPRPRKEERKQLLLGLVSEMGISLTDNRLIGFVPSRVDYEWKGQDRLFRALARRPGYFGQHMHFIFSGWGNNYNEAKQFSHANGLDECVTFLDSALSKPVLYRFYQSADFVVDQFILGMYGTAALEAMACGAPLITWLNDAYDRPWGSPPIIQARTDDDLYEVLGRIAAGAIDFESSGIALQDWMGRVHDPAAAVEDMLRKFEVAITSDAVRS